MSALSSQLTLSGRALDRLMPLHLQIEGDGSIRHAGPTFRKMLPGVDLTGSSFFDVFELIRPIGVTALDEMKGFAALPFKLRLKDQKDVPFRGVMVPSSEGVLLNLSFGISLVEAVRRFGLDAEDFAPTELAIELLYLVEAKSAVYEESQRLNARLSEARQEAEVQANTDLLTGLNNRRALLEALTELLEAGEDFTLMHVDLDYFKDVNDRYGHLMGDHVLVEVARIMEQEMRPVDVIARFGGDEFVVLLPDMTDAELVNDLAARLIARIEAPIFRDGNESRISASIGLTSSDLYDDTDEDRLLRDADAALYMSKRQGRGRATRVDADWARTGVPPLRVDADGSLASDYGT